MLSIGAVTLIPVALNDEIAAGDDLADKLGSVLRHQKQRLRSGDILVIKHKIVSKAEGQIVRLTDRINHLTQHLSSNGKDHSSRRGLLAMVARRRKLLDYLKRTEESRYTNILKALKLRR